MGWSLILLSAVRTTADEFEFVGIKFAFETALVSILPLMLAFTFATMFALMFAFAPGVDDGVGEGVGLGVTLGLGAATDPVMVNAAEAFNVLGGMQTVSLQTWYRTLIFSAESPVGASAFTVNGTLKVALPEYDSVLIPKFGSSFTAGFVPEIRPSANGPSASVIRVGIGPPAPCVIEYMCHPAPMLAFTFATPLPPAGTLAGETDIESETGAWAATESEYTATTQNAKKTILSLDLKGRFSCKEGKARPC